MAVIQNPHRNSNEETDLESTSQDDIIFQNQCFLIDMAHDLAQINFNTKYKYFRPIHGDPPSMPTKLFGNKDYEPLWSITPDILAKMQPKIRLIKVLYDKSGKEADYIEMPFAEYFDTSDLGNILQERISRGSGVGLVKFDWSLRGSNPAEAERSIQIKFTIRFETIQDFVKKRDISTSKGIRRFSFSDFFTNPSQVLNDDCSPGPPDKFNPDYFTLKVIVGWNDVDGLDENMPISFRKKLSKCLKKDTKTMILTQARHKIKFSQEGVVNIEIEAFARYDILSSINSSDIFEPYRKQYKLDLAEEALNQQTIKLRNIDNCKPRELSDSEWQKQRDDFSKREEEFLKRAEKSRDLVKTKIWASFVEELIRNNRVFNLSLPLDYVQIESDNANKYGRYGISIAGGVGLTTLASVSIISGAAAIAGGVLLIGGLSYYISRDDEERQKIRDGLTTESLRREFDTKLREFDEYIEGTPEFESLKNADHIKNRMKKRGKRVDISIWDGNAKFVSDIKKTGELIKGEDDYTLNKGAESLRNNSLRLVRDGINESEEVYNIPFFYFGDIIDFCYRVIQNGNSYNTSRNKAIVGDVTIMNPNDGRSYNINMADIPISMVSFQNWFLEAVYKKQRTNYPAREFMTDILEQLLLESLKPNKCFGDLPEKSYTFSYFEYTFPTKDLKVDPLDPKDCGRISISNLMDLKEKEHHATDAEYYNYQLFYCSSFDPESEEAQSEISDNNKGIPWIYIGKDRGLVKNIEFDRSDIAFFREAHITTEGNNHELDSLREAYQATITMVGNNFFFPGQKLFVNPSTLALGSGAEGQRLIKDIGFVGYYFVIGVQSFIEPGKFETTVNAVWVGGGDGRTSSELIRRYKESKGELTLCECENGVKVTRPKPVVPEFVQDLKTITIEPVFNYSDVECHSVFDFWGSY